MGLFSKIRDKVFGQPLKNLEQALASSGTSEQKAVAFKNFFKSVNKESNQVQAPVAAAIATVLAPGAFRAFAPAVQDKLLINQADKAIADAARDGSISSGKNTADVLAANFNSALNRGSEIAAQIATTAGNVQAAIGAFQGKKEEQPLSPILILGIGFVLILLIVLILKKK